MVSTMSCGNGPTHPGPQPQVTVYYLVWRMRPSHPWHSEELDSRRQAHERYFTLLARGVEVYFERRQRKLLSAESPA